jgi:hypothetical protein
MEEGLVRSRNPDEEIRDLERAVEASPTDRSAVRRLDAMLERRDGLVGGLVAGLSRLYALAWTNITGPDDSEDTLEDFISAQLDGACSVADMVLAGGGHYGTDTEYGPSNGVADLVWDERSKGFVETLVVTDAERDMVTVGAGWSEHQDLYSAWPDFQCYTVMTSGLTNPRAALNRWQEHLAVLSEPWLAWSRGRRELAVDVYDRIRVSRCDRSSLGSPS